MVPRGHRRRALPDRRHLVADRDRDDHDQPAARRHRRQAGLRDAPVPGVVADVVDENGDSVPNGSGGYLVVKEPWPAMLRTLWGDDQRCWETYWALRQAGYYFAGTAPRRTTTGTSGCSVGSTT